MDSAENLKYEVENTHKALRNTLACLRSHNSQPKNPEEAADLRAQSYYHLGLVYEHTEQIEKAVAAYQKAIQLHPDFVNAYNGLGIAYWKSGCHDEAIAQCKKALVKFNEILSCL